MTVSASGGTGRVATSVSCFGGLGQLYRVKVWAVSEPNIRPALVCVCLACMYIILHAGAYIVIITLCITCEQ